MSGALADAPGVLLLDDTGRLSSATPAATRLLELVRTPEEIPSSLRALSARSAMAGDDRPVVIGLPIRAHGQVILTGARAGRQLTVIIEAQTNGVQAPALALLTAREREVLELVLLGLPTKRISAVLAISRLDGAGPPQVDLFKDRREQPRGAHRAPTPTRARDRWDERLSAGASPSIGPPRRADHQICGMAPASNPGSNAAHAPREASREGSSPIFSPKETRTNMPKISERWPGGRAGRTAMLALAALAVVVSAQASEADAAVKPRVSVVASGLNNRS